MVGIHGNRVEGEGLAIDPINTLIEFPIPLLLHELYYHILYHRNYGIYAQK